MQHTIKFVTLTTPIGLATRSETQCSSLKPTIALPKRLQRLKTRVASNDSSPTTVDYSSMTSSVFPVEACETVGGEACEVDMYPEVKLESPPVKPNTASEPVEREYLQYDDQKTVFPGEACDDLGGEFCEPDYQTGIY